MGKELESRIRIQANTGKELYIEVALSEAWCRNGAYEPKEAFSILYHLDLKKGSILEAEYSGGPTYFYCKVKHEDAPLVDIPESIIQAAWNPRNLFAEEHPDFEFTEGETMGLTLQPFHFKPLSDENFNYIKENCFQLESEV